MDSAFERLNDQISGLQKYKAQQEMVNQKRITSQERHESQLKSQAKSMAMQNLKYLRVQMQQRKEAEDLEKQERIKFVEDNRFVVPSEQGEFMVKVNQQNKQRLGELLNYQKAQSDAKK